MSGFVQSEGDTAIVVENGVYKQCDIYTRDGYFYVKLGGGFVRLNVDGSTSKPKLRLDFIDITTGLWRDKVGRLCKAHVAGSLSIDEPQRMRLTHVVPS